MSLMRRRRRTSRLRRHDGDTILADSPSLRNLWLSLSNIPTFSGKRFASTGTLRRQLALSQRYSWIIGEAVSGGMSCRLRQYSAQKLNRFADGAHWRSFRVEAATPLDALFFGALSLLDSLGKSGLYS